MYQVVFLAGLMMGCVVMASVACMVISLFNSYKNKSSVSFESEPEVVTPTLRALPSRFEKAQRFASLKESFLDGKKLPDFVQGNKTRRPNLKVVEYTNNVFDLAKYRGDKNSVQTKK